MFEDADIETAARQTARAKFRNNGQVCIAISRIFVQDPVRKRFEEAFVAEAESLRIGDGMVESTEHGPRANVESITKTKELVADALGKGACLLSGGDSPGAAWQARVHRDRGDAGVSVRGGGALDARPACLR